MAKRKQKWQIGDVFLIGTSDGRFVTGQVIAVEPQLMRSATISLFDERYDSIEEARGRIACDPQTVFSVLFATVNNLNSGNWQVIGRRPVAVDPRRNKYEHTRSQGFIGAKVIGSEVVNEFVNAFYGLVAWDDWHDPQYLDSLLISESIKPVDRLVYKS